MRSHTPLELSPARFAKLKAIASGTMPPQPGMSKKQASYYVQKYRTKAKNKPLPVVPTKLSEKSKRGRTSGKLREQHE